jgi:hypothetical protein
VNDQARLNTCKENSQKVQILWYVTGMAHELGFSLATVAQMNIAKLAERYPKGFNSADSIKRRDTKTV